MFSLADGAGSPPLSRSEEKAREMRRAGAESFFEVFKNSFGYASLVTPFVTFRRR